MSDFLEADIDELLNPDKEPEKSEDDKAYQALLKQDRKLLNGFSRGSEALRWPDPIRKRHIR